MQNSIKDKLYKIAIEERQRTLQIFGTVHCKCIETSDRIFDRILDETAYDVHQKQVWVLYEHFENCYEQCYEEHWLTYIVYHGRRMYIDATMDQFQWAFSRKLPEIYIEYELPKFYLIKRPGKVILDRCGWNDWYNNGNYINNFDYYG